MTIPPAFLSEEVIIPIGIVAIVFSVPIVAMFTRHQQRMTELLHRDRPEAIDPMISHELRELKQLVQQQTLMLDRILERQDALERTRAPGPALSDRLGQSD